MMHVRNQPPAPAAWWEAVTSEFVYEQEQVQCLNVAQQQQHQQQHQPQQQTNTPLPYGMYDGRHQQPPPHQTVAQFPLGSPDQYVASNNATAITDTSSLYSAGSGGGMADSGAASPMDYACTYPTVTYAPCEGPQPWNYAYCYGYYGEPACPMMNLVDMEDFM